MAAPFTPEGLGGAADLGEPREPLFNPEEEGDSGYGSGGTPFVPTPTPRWQDDVDWGSAPMVMAQAAGAEMFKIAGLKYENREWSWSPANVTDYFKEDPFWATFDAVTVAAPFAKWGKAAYIVGQGTSAAGKAVAAGEMGFRAGVKLQARNLAPTTRLGRYITNPAARERFTPEYQELIDRFGATDWERQAGLDVMRREHAAEVAAVSTRALNVVAKINKAGLTPEQHKAWVRLMEQGADPFGDREGLGVLLGEEGKAAFESAWEFRRDLGIDALEVNAISSERALSQNTYWPQMVKGQYEQALKDKGVHFSQSDVFAEASWDNFQHRKYMTEEFEKNFVRDFDPVSGVRRMAAAFQAVKREKFAIGMRESGLVQDPQELLKRILSGEFDAPGAKRVWGMTDETMNRLKAAAVIAPKHSDGTVVEEAAARIFREHSPFARLSDVAPGLKLPNGYSNLVVDKAVAKDLGAAFDLLGKRHFLLDVHSKVMKTFMLGKTAYNPATHVRNLFGASVFHTLATGLDSLASVRPWHRGWKAYREGWKNPTFRKAAESGIINGTIDGEFDNAVRKLYGMDWHGSSLGFLGDSKFAQLAQKLGGKVENFYRGIDDVSRLDAFARNYEKFLAANKHRVRPTTVLQAQLVKRGSAEWGASELALPAGPGPVAPPAPGQIPAESGEILAPGFTTIDPRGTPPPGRFPPPGPASPYTGQRGIPPIARPSAEPPAPVITTGGEDFYHGSPEPVVLRDEATGREYNRFGPGLYGSDTTEYSGGFATRKGGKGKHYRIAPKKGRRLFDARQPIDGETAKLLGAITRGARPGQKTVASVVLDGLAENPPSLSDLIEYVSVEAAFRDIPTATVDRAFHGSLRKSIEKRGFHGLRAKVAGDAAFGTPTQTEAVWWNPKRDVDLVEVAPGEYAVQQPMPRRLTERAMGRGPTLDEAAAAPPPPAAGGAAPPQGPVPPGSQMMAAPPGGVGPARPSRLGSGRELAPATPAGVGGAKVIDRDAIAVDGLWSEAELERRAIEFASLQVAKFMPSFMLNSRLTKDVRGVIPFAGFSHEAVRVWKNAMVEKPHLAAFWSHFAEMTGQFSGAYAGFTPEEIRTARSNLPYYQEGKKMLMWPFAANGKPAFVDMSYLIPLANVVEIERDEQTLFGKVASFAGLNVTSNPVIASMVAASTGRDAFRNQPLEPRFTERQLGVSVEGYKKRAMVGLAEHVAATFLPPIVPPGYVGNNLIEHLRGQTHPTTGQPLEEGAWSTFATNILGLRTHEADANAAMLNVGHTERVMNERITEWWERWAWAVANGRNDDAERAEKNLYELRLQRGDTPEKAMKYLSRGVADREPGAYRNYPNKDLRKAVKSLQATRVGQNPSDSQAMARMMAASRNKRRGWQAVREENEEVE